MKARLFWQKKHPIANPIKNKELIMSNLSRGFVVPSGIEPLSEASETSILSVELRDLSGRKGNVFFGNVSGI